MSHSLKNVKKLFFNCQQITAGKYHCQWNIIIYFAILLAQLCDLVAPLVLILLTSKIQFTY